MAGRLWVPLRRSRPISAAGAGLLELDCTDSGKPFPFHDRASGLGMQLIGALAAQLGGSVSTTNDPRKRAIIRFPVR
jgi:two-component sensor histidine kinase